jgi:hypothetical protein
MQKSVHKKEKLEHNPFVVNVGVLDMYEPQLFSSSSSSSSDGGGGGGASDYFAVGPVGSL